MIASTEACDLPSLNRPVPLFRMTSEQFAALPECKQDIQLINGVVIMSPKPRPGHQKFLGKLIGVLDAWTEQHQLGDLFPETEMRVSDDWTPAPDLSFLRTEHLDRVGEKQILGPVDLAIEVLSPSNETTDRVDKFAAYAQFGIDWYWIVDVRRRVLEEYERVADQYGNPVETQFDQPFNPRVFPGLTIDLARLAR
jgi:Uma2 family endonuclease